MIENIRYNVSNCGISNEEQSRIVVEGFLWGSDVSPLLSKLSENQKFDVIVLSDTVSSSTLARSHCQIFNHSEHKSLVKSIQLCLQHNDEARVYVFYTHHRPWLKEKDLEFFDIAVQAGFSVDDLLTEHHTPMFKDDRGDETERSTVYGRSIKWRDET